MIKYYNQLHYKSKEKSNATQDDFVDFLMHYTDNLPEGEVDTNNAWETFQHSLHQEKQQPFYAHWWKVAASFLLIGIAIFMVWTFSHLSTSQEQLIASTSKESFLLADGSKTILNKGADITFENPFGTVRKVTLRGEAYFDVAKNTKPFVIELEGASVRVLGTAFNINQSKDKIDLFVERGEVSFETTTGTKEVLKNGMLLRFDRISKRVKIEKISHQNQLSWMTGKLNFNNTALHQVFEDIQKLYGIQVQLAPHLRECKLTAEFSGKSIAEVINIIKTTLDISAKLTPQNTIIISGEGC